MFEINAAELAAAQKPSKTAPMPTQAAAVAAQSESSAAVLPLPDLPENQRGTSVASAKHYKAEVSNAAGYLCHIHLEMEFDVPPEVLFEVFVHPDNAGVFRDIKRVGYRRVLESRPGWKRVEVEQCGELKVLWVRRVFATYLTVIEDSTDPSCLRTHFHLLRSDILSRFQGEWLLRPRRHPVTGAVTGTLGVLEQDILPRGVPPFFQHLPLLGGLLRRVSLNAIQRLVEDITHLIDEHRRTGLPMEAVMRRVAAQRGHTTQEGQDFAATRPGEPASFALGDLDGSDSEEAGDSSSGEAGNGNGNGGSSNAMRAGAGAAAGSSSSIQQQHSQQHHHHHDHRLVRVLMDVTVDGAVHLVLVPTTPELEAAAAASAAAAGGGGGGGSSV